MDALDYEKLLTNGYDSKGTRLDRERLTVLEEDVRAVAQELEEGWPAVRRIDSVRKRVLISHDVQHGGQRVLAMQPTVVNAQPDCWGVR